GDQDRHPAQHQAHDVLDVLVVDVHALAAVGVLHLVHQVLLHRPRAEDTQHLLRVDRTGDQLLADGDVVAFVHELAGTLGDLVGHLVAAVVRGDDDLARPVAVLHAHPAGHLGDGRLALGGTCFEQLGHTRQTLGDVVRARHTTGVEGTHGQLGTGLTDGLCGDDADGLADVHQLPGGQAAAVALRAG